MLRRKGIDNAGVVATDQTLGPIVHIAYRTGGSSSGGCQRVIVTTDDPELVWGGHKMSRSISLGEQYDHFQWPLAGKKLVTFLEPIRIIQVSAKAKTTPAVGNWADDDRESRDVDI